MFHIVLYQPEIPPNTGNIIRLAANSGAQLHLVQPLGFSIEDRQLRRAGLDYHEYANLRVHANWKTCLDTLVGARLFACSTKGSTRHTAPFYAAGDAFVFGPETRGLPEDILVQLPVERRLKIPMRPHNRSLNLSNAVAVVIFEAWRQLDFAGADEGKTVKRKGGGTGEP